MTKTFNTIFIMTSQLLIIIQTIVTAAATIAYILTYRYMSEKAKTMEQTVYSMKSLVDTQSQIIKDFRNYKDMYDPEDFAKTLKFKLDKQKTELTDYFLKQTKSLTDDVINELNKSYVKTNAKMLASFNELAQIPISIIMKEYPRKEHKTARDTYIKEKFPQSAEFFIGFCDAWLDGKIPPSDPT